MENENIFFVKEKKNEEGKYLDKENMYFCGEEGKGGNYLEKEKPTDRLGEYRAICLL